MRINVHEVNQAAGGGSYVCIFDAVAEFNSTGEISVLVESVEPADTDTEYIDMAQEGIRAGAASVLAPQGKGVCTRVLRLVVNTSDFKVSRFTLYTARELMRLQAGNV